MLKIHTLILVDMDYLAKIIIMNKTQKITLFIPVENLTAKWNGQFEKLPPNKIYEIVIDYPIDKPFVRKINTGKFGMSLFSLLRRIGKYYQSIYNCEEKYGVWGHEITDLIIEGININHKKKLITLDIGS